MADLNILAILVAAASSFLLGGLWYGPLFKHAWCKAANVDPDKKPGHPARVFGVSYLFSVIAAAGFSWLLGPVPGVAFATGIGLLIGLGWVATSFGINYQFAGRPLKLLAIDGGYHALQFLLYGLVFGLWH